MSTSRISTSPSPAARDETSCALMIPEGWHQGPDCVRQIIFCGASGKGLVAVCQTCGIAADLEAIAIRVSLETCGRVR